MNGIFFVHRPYLFYHIFSPWTVLETNRAVSGTIPVGTDGNSVLRLQLLHLSREDGAADVVEKNVVPAQRQDRLLLRGSQLLREGRAVVGDPVRARPRVVAELQPAAEQIVF